MKYLTQHFVLPSLLWLVAVTPVSAAIEDFNTWTLVQDPAHAGMTSSVDNAAQVTLTADGAVPGGTDIGYQSINGNTVTSSSAGYYFSIAQDFHIAVDFSVSPAASMGLAGLGFGIGEDGAGENSAGPGLAIFNSIPLSFAGASRINDVTQLPVVFGPSATNSGRFFVRYDSVMGDIVFGVNTTPGSAAPSDTGTFAGLQNSWNDDNLLVSFFLRSDSTVPLSAGTIDAVFSNFEVLAGTPVSIVPLPGGVWLLGSALGLISGLRRKRAN